MATATLEHQFQAFAKFGDAKSEGNEITLKNSDKWMKQANLFTKKFTTTDTGISYAKFKCKTMNLIKFKEYIEDLCKTKQMNEKEFIEKLVNCGVPGTTATTKAGQSDVTDRLTDTSKYTGSHKERFNADGKGKGIEGRTDVADDAGYVQGYKNKDTFDKTH